MPHRMKMVYMKDEEGKRLPMDPMPKWFQADKSSLWKSDATQSRDLSVTPHKRPLEIQDLRTHDTKSLQDYIDKRSPTHMHVVKTPSISKSKPLRAVTIHQDNIFRSSEFES